MPVYKRVDVVDTTSEALAEERGQNTGAMMTLGIVVLFVVVMLVGYFAWYAPNQAAANPTVIEHTSTTTNTTTTPAPGIPAPAPPIVINQQPPVVVHDQAPPATPAPSPSPSPTPSTDSNTSGNSTGAGTSDDGSKSTTGN